MDGGAWWAAVHGVVKSWTRLSNFTVTFHFHALEKEMATHSSVLAWRIPGTEEPGGLLSMGSQRVRHNWSDLAAAAACINSYFLRKWKSLSRVRLCVTPWNSPGQNTEVGSYSLLQGIFPTQGSNPGLLHYRQILYQLSHQGRLNMY